MHSLVVIGSVASLIPLFSLAYSFVGRIGCIGCNGDCAPLVSLVTLVSLFSSFPSAWLGELVSLASFVAVMHVYLYIYVYKVYVYKIWTLPPQS
jgi:hypothetical protein